MTIIRPNKKYIQYCNNCSEDGIKPMNYNVWKTHHNPSSAKLSKWKNAKYAPSLWEKIDKDPIYRSILELRVRDCDASAVGDQPTMGFRKK